MDEITLASRRITRNRKPQVVRKVLADGTVRFYCYARRGGPFLFARDSERPSNIEIAEAMKATPCSCDLREPVKRPRGKNGHRPLFIKELIRLYADSERWTYFIGCGGKVKIGAAKCVRSRLKILQAHNPEVLEVLAMVRGGEVLESAYHALFAKDRIGNEWFTLSPEIMAEIASLSKDAT